jgi:hypothetical protein
MLAEQKRRHNRGVSEVISCNQGRSGLLQKARIQFMLVQKPHISQRGSPRYVCQRHPY